MLRKPIQIISALESTDRSILELSSKIRDIYSKELYQKNMSDETHNEATCQIVQHEGVCTHSAILVGLHACGDLSCSTLKLFASDASVLGICLVSCCYHKMKDFPMSQAFKERAICTYEFSEGSITKDYSDLKSPHALRLASQEPFSRYYLFLSKFRMKYDSVLYIQRFSAVLTK